MTDSNRGVTLLWRGGRYVVSYRDAGDDGQGAVPVPADLISLDEVDDLDMDALREEARAIVREELGEDAR